MKADTIQISLLKLKEGSRLLRLTESETGLVLERVVNPGRPVLPQKRKLRVLFEAMLQRAEMR